LGLGYSSVIEHLPTMHEVLGLIASTKKEKAKKKKFFWLLGMVSHTCNLSTLEAEEGSLVQV
jgi:predicted transcriptional regulator